MRPAVELSYLDEDSQRDLVDEIDLNQATPSHAQAIRMRQFAEKGTLTTEVIQAIMGEEKPNQKERIVLRGDMVRKYIPNAKDYYTMDGAVYAYVKNGYWYSYKDNSWFGWQKDNWLYDSNGNPLYFTEKR